MRPIERLQTRLQQELVKFLGPDIQSVTIYGTKGAYRHVEYDCRPWTGHIAMKGTAITYDIASWDTMTTCLRGCEVVDNRKDVIKSREADFEVWATHQKRT